MQKTELIAQVAKKTGLTQVETAKIVNATLDTIVDTLKAGDKVGLIGFGTFEVRKTAARNGVNPSTQAKIRIAAGQRAAFSAGTVLKTAVSGKPKPKAAPKKAVPGKAKVAAQTKKKK